MSTTKIPKLKVSLMDKETASDVLSYYSLVHYCCYTVKGMPKYDETCPRKVTECHAELSKA